MSISQRTVGRHSGQLLRVAAPGRTAPPACGSPRGCGNGPPLTGPLPQPRARSRAPRRKTDACR